MKQHYSRRNPLLVYNFLFSEGFQVKRKCFNITFWGFRRFNKKKVDNTTCWGRDPPKIETAKGA